MKKAILLLAFLFVSISSYSQDFTILQKNKFANAKDYKKARPEILKLANYLLNTPAKPSTDNNKMAINYIYKWMTGSDFTFAITVEALILTKGPSELYTMYWACLTKIALTDPNSYNKMTDGEIYDIASKMLAEYCSERKNKLKPSKALKKIIKKMKKG